MFWAYPEAVDKDKGWRSLPRSLQRPFLFTLQETCVLLLRSTSIFSGLEGQMKTILVHYSWKGGGICGAHVSWLLVESSVGERKTNKGKLNLEEGEESKVAPHPKSPSSLSFWVNWLTVVCGTSMGLDVSHYSYYQIESNARLLKEKNACLPLVPFYYCSSL